MLLPKLLRISMACEDTGLIDKRNSIEVAATVVCICMASHSVVLSRFLAIN